VTDRLYFIVDMYVKSRENPEHQYRVMFNIGHRFDYIVRLFDWLSHDMH